LFIWSPSRRWSGTLMTVLEQMKADCGHSSDSMCCDEQFEVYAVLVARISSPFESAVRLWLCSCVCCQTSVMYVHFLKYVFPVSTQWRCVDGMEVKLYILTGNVALTCSRNYLIFYRSSEQTDHCRWKMWYIVLPELRRGISPRFQTYKTSGCVEFHLAHSLIFSSVWSF
jgi:hypothetical protein